MTDIAIIGMAAILPGATDISEYWDNILNGANCIIDIPEGYWVIDDFYDPDPAAKDKTYAYKAGVVVPVEFDSIGFGIPPLVMESISVDQLYALVVAKKALLDAGLIGKNARPFNKEKTGVVLAAASGKNAYSLSRRQDMVRTREILVNSGVGEALADRIIERLKDAELEWTEASEPGFLANVVAGRIANRFDLGGTNCVVDAACASSLAALKIAMDELQSGACDVMITGGINLDLSPTTFISFCKTPALSPHNVSRPFDADADGMILGDGAAMVVLKRLEDAVRDEDRIYAVIKSVGSSSDGRDRSIFAPSTKGQIRAIERAYEVAGVDPAGTTLIEAHGTGTYAGDECEITALNELYGRYPVEPRSIVVGSVKSQIGHTRMAAGVAGLIKAALSLYHKTLPPTINVNKERPEFEGSPFRTISEPLPWITSEKAPVRRAGLSSFGFGGANFHTVLEEYIGVERHPRLNHVPEGICLTAADTITLAALCDDWAARLEADPSAYSELVDSQQEPEPIPVDQPRVGFIGRNSQDTVQKLREITSTLTAHDFSGESRNFTVGGDTVYYRASGVPAGAKVATLFSSQSAQYPSMMGEVARDYPEMSDFLSLIGSTLETYGLTPISEILYAETPTDASKQINDCQLTNTVYSQAALAAICGGLYEIMEDRHYTDDIVIGHSFGEITGLWAAGAIDARMFAELTVERGMAMASARTGTGMLVIAADAEASKKWIEGHPNLEIANENSPDQTMVSGDTEELKVLAGELIDAGVPCSVLNVSHAFHSPYMKEPNSLFQTVLADTEFAPLTKTLYSGAEGEPYGETVAEVRGTIGKQMEEPVRFMQCVVDAYEAGARVFVEVGPGKVLTNLVRRILADKDIETIAVNGERGAQSSQVQLEEALVQLRTLGLTITGDGYRQKSSDIASDDKPKSAYLVDPIQYLTPAKREIVNRAIYTVDPVDPVASVDPVSESHTNMKGQQAMDTRGLDVVYGIQSLNGQALEKFLASQEQQMSVFSQLLKDGGSDDVLGLMEAFQANSMRAYDAYMMGQRDVLSGGTGADIPMEVTARPLPAPKAVEAPAPHRDPVPPKPLPAPVPETAVPQRSAAVVPAKREPEPNTVTPLERGIGDMGDMGKAEDLDPVAMIISIISEKTGYPEDMVDADMNIETDLGIDSIKRIEVFAELSNRLPNKLEVDDVEAISMLHTISEIGDYVKKKFAEVGDGSAASADETDSHLIKRFDVGIREAEPQKRTDAIRTSGTVVIVRDDSGVAEILADKMNGMGYAARLVGLPEPDESTVEQMFTDVLADANQPLTGFVYVASHRDSSSLLAADEITALKSVFLCAKYFTRAFVSGADNGFFVSAARIDGRLGLGSQGSAVQGGLFGLHKSLTIEWHDLPLNTRTILSKAVDVAGDVPPELAADDIIEEIFTYANDAGVGRTKDGKRFETCLTENYPDAEMRGSGPEPDDVLLVTGGGRGITAQCVLRLAETCHCGFLLLGRTDIGTDIGWAGEERDRAKLRELAIVQLGQAHPKPAKVEALVDSVFAQREIRQTLGAIRAAGGRADYVSCDVRDADRLKEVIRDEEARLGPITGLVHGAGSIADKTVQRKTAADFDSVFGSKVLGLDACLGALDADRLTYIVMFSSTSGYFGNGGQTDYSMANEVMNKFAFSFKKAHPTCTTVAVNWGLWDGGSMASDSIRNAVKDSEIRLIPMEVGTGYFVDQFVYPQKPDVCQIVINCSSEMLRPKTEV